MYDQHQHSLDSLVELGKISADVRAFFVYFADFDVNQWFANIANEPSLLQLNQGDSETCTPDYLKPWQMLLCQRATERYNEWFNRTNGIERAVCINQAIAGFYYTLSDCVKCVISGEVDRQTKAGNFDVQLIANTMLDGYSHVAIIECNNSFQQILKLWNEVYTKACLLGKPTLQAAARYWEGSELNPTNRLYQKVLNDITQLEHDVNNNIDVEAFARRIESKDKTILRKKKHIIKKLKIKKRKIIKRSLKFLTQFAGSTTTRLFVGGQNITLQGQQFNFIVTKKSLTSPYGGINLKVSDKQGNDLVKLCWYIENTPAPEQLAGLMMHVFHGNEDEILQTANIISSYNLEKCSESFQLLRKIRDKTGRKTKFHESRLVQMNTGENAEDYGEPENYREPLDDSYNDLDIAFHNLDAHMEDIMGCARGYMRVYDAVLQLVKPQYKILVTEQFKSLELKAIIGQQDMSYLLERVNQSSFGERLIHHEEHGTLHVSRVDNLELINA